MTNEQFEQEVLTEIFAAVVDSTYLDKRTYTSFPEFGKAVYDQHGKWIGRDTAGQHNRNLIHKIKMDVLKNDTLNLIIAIGKGGLITDKTDLEQYNTRKFTFKNLSELPPTSEYDNWTAKYSKFAGVIIFSNIKFDVTKKYGFLNVSYICGGKCGLGYRVTIKKVDHKWVISKIEDTWIS